MNQVMNYNKTIWKDTTKLTPAYLNNIENGIFNVYQQMNELIVVCNELKDKIDLLQINNQNLADKLEEAQKKITKIQSEKKKKEKEQAKEAAK